MYIYVNNTLFGSYNDIAGAYTSIPGKPVYIFRDDQQIPCEMGEANFGYLSFKNIFSTQSTVDSIYNDICNISNASVSANFSVTPNPICQSQLATVKYTGDIPSPGTGFTFDWNWNNATVVSGSGMGPYTVYWNNTGLQTISLTVTNNVCANKNSDTLDIFVNSPRFSSINASICEGNSFEGYTASGTYIDTLVSVAGCDSIRTLILSIKPKAYSTFTQTICEGQSFMGYSATGVYQDILIATNGCDSIRTIDLTVKPGYFSMINQSICEGQSFLGYNITGIYKDTLIAANGCDSIRTLNLIVIEKPKPDLGPDKEICEGDSLTLSPGNFSSYLWQNGSALQSIVASQPGVYSVTVTETCGSAIDNVRVKTKDCTPYFPSAFTPNNDGKNDLFKILNAYNLQQYELVIYNRWGQKIFQTKDPSIGWDGVFGGRSQNAGIYVWYSNFKRNGMQTNLKGTLILIR
jgi:gliding motility-associated-like protein